MRRLRLLAGVTLAMLTLYTSPVAAPQLDPAAVAHWPWDEPVECVEYIVGVGDTPWAIAGRYYPNLDPGIVLGAIYLANGQVEFEPGRTIWIPDPARYGVGRERIANACGR